MAISKVNPVSTSSVNAQAISTTTANVQKTVVRTFTPGVYQISVSPTSSVAIVQFLSGTTWIGQTQTSAGSINFNLGSTADKIYVQSNNVNDVVSINLVASVPITNEVNGTLDTITANGTYSQTGLLWVLAIGGGGGGGGGKQNYSQGGGGGASGAMSMFYGNVFSTTNVTIGTAGTGGAPNTGGGAGTTTSFGTYAVAVGGGGGGLPDGPGGVAASGTSSGTVVIPSTGGVLVNTFRAIKNGTTGGGGGAPNGAGAGSGIGTGGNGASGGGGTAPSGTGFGAGGGGGGSNNGSSPGNGGNGSPGVIYVLRGFN